MKKAKSGFFKNIIRAPYYYVPPCPSCGSRITGRYVKMHRDTEMEYMNESSLKNGEIIAFMPEIPRNNFFCVECGFEWRGICETSMFTLDEIRAEKDARHTDEMLVNEQEELAEDKRNKQNKPLYHLGRFIGKI